MKDVKSFPVVAEIAVNSGPVGSIAATADGRQVLATNYRGNSVSVIDTRSGTVIQTIIGIEEPFAVAMAGAGNNRAYVNTASAAYDAIVAIDMRANTVVATHPLAFSVTDLAVSTDGKHAYASRSEEGRADIAVLNTTTGDIDVIEIAAVPGTTADHVRISEDGQRLYVAANGPYDGRLVVIDARERQVTCSIQIGSPIRDVALSSDGGTAYVASSGTEFGAVVDVIDTGTNTITSTAKVGEIGAFVTQLALSSDGDRAYLVSNGGVTVLSLPTQEVIGTITASTQPSCVIESPDGSRLYVADYSGVVTVLMIASPVLQTADDDSTADLPEPLMLDPAVI